MRKTVFIISFVLGLLFVLSCGCYCLLGIHEAPSNLAKVKLNIETYAAGDNQATHPSVISFDDEWNGYKYWMAYSPYPYGNGEEENPCLCASNDLYSWVTPKGLANPIADNEDTGCAELKDPHLVYRDDLDRLEVWYLGRISENLGGDGTTLLLFRKTSQDGIHWSEYEVMSETQYLSQSVLWDGQQYLTWGIGYEFQGTEGTVVCQSSSNGNEWSEPVLCTINGENSNLDIWHGSVTEFDGQYHFVYIDNEMQNVYYTSCVDGVNFDAPQQIVSNNKYWDFLYRPFFLKDNGQYYCYYGIVNEERQWYLSMSKGGTVEELSGIDSSDISKMPMLTKESEVSTHGMMYRIKKLYHAICNDYRPEFMVVAVVSMLLFCAMNRAKAECRLVVAELVAMGLYWALMYYRFKPIGIENYMVLVAAIALYSLINIWIMIGINSIRNKQK